MLNDFVENIDIQSLTLEELDEVKENKSEAIYINNFKLVYNILSKYGKELSYVEEIDKYPMKCLIVFPSTASLFQFEDEYELRELKEKLEGLLPSKIKVYNKGTYDITELRNQELIRGMYNNGYIINGEDYRYKSNYSSKEIPILANAKLCSDNKGNYTNAEYETTNNNELNLEDEKKNKPVDKIRDEHEHKFRELLESNDCDVIINASGQGVGKNTTLCKHILDNKLKNDNYTTILFTPRKAIMRSMINDIKELINKEKTKYGSIDSELKWICEIYSNKNVSVSYKRGMYHEQINEYESSSSKLREIVENRNKDYNLILCTSQTLPYYLGINNENIVNSIRYLLKHANLIVFDELSNSDMTVKWAFLRILRYLRDVKNQYKHDCKIVVLDASITSKYLYFKMLNEHLSLSNKARYTPFDVKIMDDEGEGKYEIEGIKIHYFKKNIDFNLNIFPVIIQLDESVKYSPNKYASPSNIRKILDWVNEELTCRAQGFDDVYKILKNHQGIFYIDNKLVIDSIVEYLKNKNYGILSLQAERVGKIDMESLNKSNIIGTSSIAFGMSFPFSRLLIALPPVINSRYYDSLSQIELMRQVIKRMRGREKDSMVKCIAVCDVITSDEQERISYHIVNNAINRRILNKKYHIIPPYYSGDIAPIRISNENEMGKSTQISFEKFIKDYYPSLRRIFGIADINLKMNYHINVDKAAVSGLVLPPYIAYDIKNRKVGEFKLELTPLKRGGCSRKLIKLFDEQKDRVVCYEEGLRILYSALFKTHIQDIKEEHIAKIGQWLKEKLGKIKSAKNDKSIDYAFCRILGNKLTPSKINISPKTGCVLTLPWVEESGSNNEVDNDTYSILCSRGAPSRNFFFGDSNYLEELINIKFERNGKEVGQSKGFYVHHPIMGTTKFKTLMIEVCSKEFITSKTIIPHISKLI